MNDLALPAQTDAISSHREQMQALYREAHPGVVARWIERLMAQGKVEDLRKAAELLAKLTAAGAERDTDANSSLPVFNIVFNTSAGQTVQLVDVTPPDQMAAPAELLELVEDTLSKRSTPEDLLQELQSDIEGLFERSDA